MLLNAAKFCTLVPGITFIPYGSKMGPKCSDRTCMSNIFMYTEDKFREEEKQRALQQDPFKLLFVSSSCLQTSE